VLAPHYARSRADLGVAGIVFGWITVVLLADGQVSLAGQRVLGLATWALLIALLRRESGLVRAQVTIVIAFASAIEYTFSPFLGVYLYRLHNVPAFVPPGHGLVYLCAMCLGRTCWLRRRRREFVALTVLVGGGYAGYQLLQSRHDVLGAFWFGCLLGFLWLVPTSRTLYVGAFAIVTYLELLGTHLHTWAWQPHDPTGWVSIGNPPSGAAGGYGWFDLAAILGAPAILRGTHWLRQRVPSLRPAHPPSRANAAACNSPLDPSALPPAGPARPVRSVNRPPASVTTSAGAARSCSATSGSAATSTVPSASNM
jgi:hypothetical protein